MRNQGVLNHLLGCQVPIHCVCICACMSIHMRTQGVLNDVLGCQNTSITKSHTLDPSVCWLPRQSPAWSVLDEALVTGSIGDVTSRTYAYHAVGVGRSYDKNKFLWRAHRKAQYPHGHEWCDIGKPAAEHWATAGATKGGAASQATSSQTKVTASEGRLTQAKSRQVE